MANPPRPSRRDISQGIGRRRRHACGPGHRPQRACRRQARNQDRHDRLRRALQRRGEGVAASRPRREAGRHVRHFPDRLQSKYDWFKKNLPNQVIADQDHLFAGFDGYKKVIESVDVVLIACASKFHPMYAEAGHPRRQARLRREAARHRSGRRPPHAGRRRPGEGEEPEPALGIAKPLSQRLSRGGPADPRRGDRQGRRHAGHVPPRPVPARQPQSGLQRDAVPVQQLVSFLLAFRRRRDAVAGAQHGPRGLDPQGGNARLVLRAGRPLGLVRRCLRRHVRSSHGGLRVRQRHAGLRPLPHAERLLRQLRRHHHGHQGPVRSGRCRITGETNWSFKGPA